MDTTDEKQWKGGAGGLREPGAMGEGVGVMGRVYEIHHVLAALSSVLHTFFF